MPYAQCPAAIEQIPEFGTRRAHRQREAAVSRETACTEPAGLRSEHAATADRCLAVCRSVPNSGICCYGPAGTELWHVFSAGGRAVPRLYLVLSRRPLPPCRGSARSPMVALQPWRKSALWLPGALIADPPPAGLHLRRLWPGSHRRSAKGGSVRYCCAAAGRGRLVRCAPDTPGCTGKSLAAGAMVLLLALPEPGRSGTTLGQRQPRLSGARPPFPARRPQPKGSAGRRRRALAGDQADRLSARSRRRRGISVGCVNARRRRPSLSEPAGLSSLWGFSGRDSILGSEDFARLVTVRAVALR